MKDFAIFVFGHTRANLLGDLLESLKRQSAIGHVELWLDGYQGNPETKNRVEVCRRIGDSFRVANRLYHNGQLGFRKMMLQAMQYATVNYRQIVFLEDDCFPTRHAIDTFRRELDAVENAADVFSVYGHPFLIGEHSGYCTRFQGWGWATTNTKLAPYVDPLVRCYSMSEFEFLQFTQKSLTSRVRGRLDVTPPRLPSDTLTRFFAWDETLALLTALDNKTHKRTEQRVIYNCGMGTDSAHFRAHEHFRAPPFNLIAPDEVWDVF